LAGDVAVRDFGGSGAPLLLLHGAGANLVSMQPLAGKLSPQFRVIAAGNHYRRVGAARRAMDRQGLAAASAGAHQRERRPSTLKTVEISSAGQGTRGGVRPRSGTRSAHPSLMLLTCGGALTFAGVRTYREQAAVRPNAFALRAGHRYSCGRPPQWPFDQGWSGALPPGPRDP
jgi:hypothetical protein